MIASLLLQETRFETLILRMELLQLNQTPSATLLSAESAFLPTLHPFCCGF